MRRAAVALALLLGAGDAGAHGGLPVSLRVLRQGDGATMYVPVVFWGIWVGSEGQPWRWICEEAINDHRFRRYALSPSGIFYATDARGLDVSRDAGCTWGEVTGEIATRRLTDVATDPADGAVAYAASADSGEPLADGGAGPADNAVWVTRDAGASFTRLAGLAQDAARFFHSVRVAPSDARTIYVASTQPAPDYQPALHVSTDGGETFTRHPITLTVDGTVPHSLDILAVDPRVPGIVYVRLFAAAAGTARQLLARSTDGGATFTEVLRVDGASSPSGYTRGIDGVAVDPTRGRVLVATSKGLYAGDDPGGAASVTLAPVGNLSQAQCVDVRNGVVYACSTNYMPDFAALARSEDGAQTFSSILKYVDTVGPVECPAGTTVANVCPDIWRMYGSQLGIAFDGGAPDGGGPGPAPGGCGCNVAGRGAGWSALALALALFAALGLRSRGSSRAR